MNCSEARLSVCDACERLRNEAGPRRNMTVFKAMLKEIRRREDLYNDGSQVAFVIRVRASLLVIISVLRGFILRPAAAQRVMHSRRVQHRLYTEKNKSYERISVKFLCRGGPGRDASKNHFDGDQRLNKYLRQVLEYFATNRSQNRYLNNV